MLLESIDPARFCKKLIEQNTPEEFAYIIYDMMHGTDEEAIFGISLVVMSASINMAYSQVAYTAYIKLVKEKADESE